MVRNISRDGLNDMHCNDKLYKTEWCAHSFWARCNQQIFKRVGLQTPGSNMYIQKWQNRIAGISCQGTSWPSPSNRIENTVLALSRNRNDAHLVHSSIAMLYSPPLRRQSRTFNKGKRYNKAQQYHARMRWHLRLQLDLENWDRGKWTKDAQQLFT